MNPNVEDGMDDRRLNTGQVLGSGILGKSAPETDVPEDRERVDAQYEWGSDYIGGDAVREAVEDGKVVESANYYGIPIVWRDGDEYRGTLLQYRSVTEAPAFDDVDEAVAWFTDRCAATFG